MSQPYTLDEDLYALSALIPVFNVEKQLARYLQLIQMSASREQLSKWVEQVAGYMQAPSDLDLLSAEQEILLRELVTRANFRCVLNP